MRINENPNAETSVSQCVRMLAYMKQGHGLTGLEAVALFGCICLPRRIKDLKEKGFNISDEWITTESGKRVKRYFIAES